MPSGPKKRLRAKRKKQGSPATDANSDRETEAMSIGGSMDVDDLESGLDTPGKVSARPSFFDRDTVSSQTVEWVRVSDFDVGTPTSQTGENEPSVEDGDTSCSRRSLDKLAEWETVSGENIPQGQEGSINSLEEEASEVEAASVHSSESYTHLPSPHPAGGDKDVHTSDSDRLNRREKSSSISSSSSSSEGMSPPPSAAVEAGEEVFLAPHVSPVPSEGKGELEEILTLNEDAVEKEVVHEAAPEIALNVLSDETEAAADEETSPQSTYGDDKQNTLSSDDAVQGSHGQDEEKTPLSYAQALAAINPDEEKVISSLCKDISEVESPLNILFPEEETARESKEGLPIAGDFLREGTVPGEDEKLFSAVTSEFIGSSATASSVDLEDKDVNMDEKGLPSTSADAEEETSKNDDADFEVATFVGKNVFDLQELAASSVSVKPLSSSGASEPMALVDERHLAISTTLGEKNGIEKPHFEAKSSSGCCGVLYWLLGWDH